MKRLFEYTSLVAVAMLIHSIVSSFDRMDGFIRGPLNPYAFFTDDVRCSLEQASKKVIKGDLSTEDARSLLRKYDVRRCSVYDGTVCWMIPYLSRAKSVEYIYSPGKPSAHLECEEGYKSLGNGWYWRQIR